MAPQLPDYRIDIKDGEGWRRELANDRDFRIDEDRIVRGLCVSLPPLERDLVHVAMAVYAADRLARRRYKTHESARNVQLRVQVSSPSVWTGLRDVIEEALFFLSHDRWELQFEQGHFKPIPGGLFSLRDEPVVCLYSGGLDSAAGLAGRLRYVDRQIVCVTACHQPGQKQRVQSQIRRIAAVHNHEIFSLAVRTALVRPPLLKEQELSQRCRSFLFCALGAAVSSICGSDTVEVYENGVGALNLPPLAGMAVGARATKGCHPHFLRLMSDVASSVGQRSIKFELPFAGNTKAEVVTSLTDGRLAGVGALTTSCVHFPLREGGSAKQCGVCFACIGRRQALWAAGVADPTDNYKFDLFGSAASADCVPTDQLEPMRAILLQVSALRRSRGHREIAALRRYANGTGAVSVGEPMAAWATVLNRYRDEWLRLIPHLRQKGIRWANLIAPAQLAS